jgi:hypothetical protein
VLLEASVSEKGIPKVKQHVYETTIIHIKDSRTNLLEERGNENDTDTVQPWISHDEPSVLCLGLMGRLFDQDCVFPWNLDCVTSGHDGFWAWDSFSQSQFVHDDGFGPISWMVHSAK